MISRVSKNTAVKDQRLKSKFLNMSHLTERWCKSISEPVDRSCKSVYSYLITCCVLRHMRKSNNQWVIGVQDLTVIFHFIDGVSEVRACYFLMSSVHSSKRCEI